MPGKNDFANCRKMSEPFANADEANAALNNFYALVEAARKQFCIMDVHVIVKLPIMTKDGEEGQALSSAHYGSSLEGLGMCAWGMGEAQGELNALIGVALAGKKR